MLAIIINICLYLAVLLFYVKDKRQIDVYFIILFAYTTTAIMGLVSIELNIFSKTFTLSVFRYIYLFVAVMISLHPYRALDCKNKHIYIAYNSQIRYFLYFFLIMGIISAYYTLPKAIMLTTSGEWNELRNSIYAGESEITLYDSQFERFAKNCYSYLSPFGSIMAFYQLTQKKINKFLTISLFSVWLCNAYASATLVASRGMIMILFMKIAILYVLFKNIIPQNRKRVILIIAGILCFFFISYIVIVTASRFEDDSVDSIISYSAQSMLCFNDGIMRTMHDYAWGKYQFGWIIDLLGGDSSYSIAALGGTCGTAFISYVGNIYVDFGPVWTLFVITALSLIVRHYTIKDKYILSDIIIIAFTATWFLEGVMVFGKNQSLTWIMVFVVYYIVKAIEKKQNY